MLNKWKTPFSAREVISDLHQKYKVNIPSRVVRSILKNNLRMSLR